jgi:hypothetical protein
LFAYGQVGHDHGFAELSQALLRLYQPNVRQRQLLYGRSASFRRDTSADEHARSLVCGMLR